MGARSTFVTVQVNVAVPVNVPAVAVTAYASLLDRDEALSAGYDWHVPKPVEPNELVDAIANVISVTRTPPSAETPDSAKP